MKVRSENRTVKKKILIMRKAHVGQASRGATKRQKVRVVQKLYFFLLFLNTFSQELFSKIEYAANYGITPWPLRPEPSHK